jgi:hypothetical protein
VDVLADERAAADEQIDFERLAAGTAKDHADGHPVLASRLLGSTLD